MTVSATKSDTPDRPNWEIIHADELKTLGLDLCEWDWLKLSERKKQGIRTNREVILRRMHGHLAGNDDPRKIEISMAEYSAFEAALRRAEFREAHFEVTACVDKLAKAPFFAVCLLGLGITFAAFLVEDYRQKELPIFSAPILGLVVAWLTFKERQKIVMQRYKYCVDALERMGKQRRQVELDGEK